MENEEPGSSSPSVVVMPTPLKRDTSGGGGPGGGVENDGNVDQNRDFYRVEDVRPPYTYAALIRQVNNTGCPGNI